MTRIEWCLTFATWALFRAVSKVLWSITEPVMEATVWLRKELDS